MRVLVLNAFCERPTLAVHPLPSSSSHDTGFEWHLLIEKIVEDPLNVPQRTIMTLIYQRTEQNNIKQSLHVVLKCVLQFVTIKVEHSHGHKTPCALKDI